MRNARNSSPSSERTRVRRRPQRGAYDRETIDAILDEGFVCHVACARDGYVSVLPTAYARHEDEIYLHGAVGNRQLGALRDGTEACICVTLVDGLVLARSAFHHSINYRSVVLYGRAREVVEESEKTEAMRRFVEHVVPHRWADVRAPDASELRQTLVVAFPIVEASAKVRGGPPLDAEKDLSLPFWAGVIPLHLAAGEPVPAPDQTRPVPMPAYVRSYVRPGRPRTEDPS